MKKAPFPIGLALLLTSACIAPHGSTTPVDVLTQVRERGTLVVSVDPAYPPQSQIRAGAERAADTRCAFEQLTGTELEGFDVEVAQQIAQRLGVEACFVTPDWLEVLSGDWKGKWDLSVGSMAITPGRMATLTFTQPYYATPATFFVHQDASYLDPGELSGKKIGVCSGCTYQSYLEGTLSLPGQQIEFTVQDAEIMEFATEALVIQELAWGDGVKLDAVLIASPIGNQAIADGLPIKPLGEPAYQEYLSAAVGKVSEIDTQAFVVTISGIVRGLHSDGTLRSLSEKYYGEDLTEAAARFDASVLE